MPTVFEESQMRFEFSDDFSIRKFDNTLQHRKIADRIPNTKAVDFAGLYGKNSVFLMEVKNFRDVPLEKESELIAEVSQKIRDSVPCIVSAARDSTNDQSFWQELAQKLIHPKRNIHIIFWLEENNIASGFRQKSRLSILSNLLKRNCKWLNTKALVISSQNISIDGISTTFLPK